MAAKGQIAKSSKLKKGTPEFKYDETDLVEGLKKITEIIKKLFAQGILGWPEFETDRQLKDKYVGVRKEGLSNMLKILFANGGDLMEILNAPLDHQIGGNFEVACLALYLVKITFCHLDISLIGLDKWSAISIKYNNKELVFDPFQSGLGKAPFEKNISKYSKFLTILNFPSDLQIDPAKKITDRLKELKLELPTIQAKSSSAIIAENSHAINCLNEILAIAFPQFLDKNSPEFYNKKWYLISEGESRFGFLCKNKKMANKIKQFFKQHDVDISSEKTGSKQRVCISNSPAIVEKIKQLHQKIKTEGLKVAVVTCNVEQPKTESKVVETTPPLQPKMTNTDAPKSADKVVVPACYPLTKIAFFGRHSDKSRAASWKVVLEDAGESDEVPCNPALPRGKA